MPLTASKRFKISVAQNELTATLSVNGDSLPRDTTEAELLAELNELEIKVSPEGKEGIKEFIKSISQGIQPEAVVIARGTEPIADKNGYVKKLYTEPEKPEPVVSTGDEQEDAANSSVTCNPEMLNQNPKQPPNGTDSQSHYEKSCYVFVEADQPVAQLMPPTPGKDGENVFGKPIPRAKGLEADIKLGKNVRIGDPEKKDAEEKSDTIYADIYGKLGHSTQKIWVDEDLEVHSDVDFSIGNIDFENNVDIFRNVLDLFQVKAGKDLNVRGVVEAAKIKAGGNIILRGGMAGKEKGEIHAGQNIECKFITSSKVHCGGDLTLIKEVMYCDIFCKGSIISERGQLSGGNISAFKGISVHTLGSDAGSKTIVEIGMNEDLKRLAANAEPEVKKLKMQAKKIREIVEPLLNNQKRLSNEQKEKATELLYETYELDSKADDIVEKLKEAYLDTKENSVQCVTVLGKIHPNVTIRFPRGESKITSEIDGPVKITPELVKKVTKLKVTNTKTGISKMLDYGASYDEQWNEVEEFLGLK